MVLEKTLESPSDCKEIQPVQPKGDQSWAFTDSDNELLIVKFRLKMKKVGENTRPFRYDINQIPYDYTVKVTNKFKGYI